MSETATLGGGCYWCLDAVFRQLRGVERVESGFAGGTVKNPSYREVCGGKTGHAEVVQVTFDPQQISYADLLRVFFSVHDPTTLNRQGNDTGTQYRSAIFYHSPGQQRTAKEIMSEVAGLFKDPLVTELVPFTAYYPAEDYHQDYFANNPDQPYCAAVIAPKVAKFRKQHLERLTR